MTNLTDLYVDSMTLNSIHLHEDIGANGAISLREGVVTISKAGVNTTTIVNPVATTDDFKRLHIVSLTANAHTLAVTASSFGGGGGGEDLATFANKAGSSITLMAYQGLWYAIYGEGVAIT